MKRQWKGFFSGVLATLLVVGLIGTAAAAGRQTQATLNYTGINITFNGQKVTPKDAFGNAVEPFIIDGTTYLPLRGVAQILGLEVAWDAGTNTAALSDQSSGESRGTVLLEQNGLKITYLGIEANTGLLGGYQVKLKLENSSPKNYMVQIRDLSVNGVMSSSNSFSTTVTAGKTANDAILVYHLEEDGITAPIKQAEFYFMVYNNDDWTDSFKSGVLTVK